MLRLLPPALLLLALGLLWFWIGDAPTPGTQPAQPSDSLSTEDVASVESDPTSAADSAPQLTRDPAVTDGPAASLPALPDGRAAARVTLRLVDALSQPIEGAQVNLTEEDRYEADAVAAATSGPDGVVSLLGPVGVGLELRAAGSAWVEIRHTLAPLTEGQRLDLGDLVLQSGGQLIGRVTDSQGRGLAGAEVGLEESGSSLLRNSSIHLYTATDDEGRYRLAGIPAGQFRLRVRCSGFLASEMDPVRVDGHGREHNQDFQLERGRVVEGQVVDADHRPIAGAEVAPDSSRRLDSMDFRMERPRVSRASRTPSLPGAVVTDAEGRFTLGGIDDHSDHLLARAAGHGSRQQPLPEEGVPVLIRLEPRFGIQGRLLLPDESPASGVQVQLKGTDSERNPWASLMGLSEATSDADGFFELMDLQAGDYQLSAYHPMAEVVEMPLHLQGNEDGLEIQMQSAEHLTVRVVDSAGEPLSDVALSVRAAASDSRGSSVRISLSADGAQRVHRGNEPSVHGRTDEDGFAILPGVASGSRRLRMTAPGFATLDHAFTRDQGPQHLDLTLPKAATLHVQLLAPDGKVLPGVEVYMDPDVEEWEELKQTSDLAGRVAWSDLLPGVYSLGYREGGGEGSFFQILGGPEAADDGQDVECLPLEEGAHLQRVIVVDSLAFLRVQVLRSGQPVAGAQVWLETLVDGPMAGFLSPTPSTTDGAGWVDLPPREAGRYRLFARAGNHAPEVEQEIEIHDGSQDFTVEVLGATLRGRLMADGRGLVGASLTLQEAGSGAGDGGPRQMAVGMVMVSSSSGGARVGMESGDPRAARAVTDGDGSFHFIDVPPGRYRAVSSAPGFESWESEVLEVGEVGELDIGTHTLFAGARIYGRDLNQGEADPDSGMAIGSLLRLLDEDGETVAVTLPQPTGNYSFEDIAPGRYQLSQGTWKSEAIDLGRGEELPFDIPKQ